MNLLDNDLYKFYVSQQIWRHYRETQAEFRLQIRSGSGAIPTLQYTEFAPLTDDQLSWLNRYLDTDYLEWLAKVLVAFDPSAPIVGNWAEITLVEVPILSQLSARREATWLPAIPKGIWFSEIGTRRRCSREYHAKVLHKCMEHDGFLGTSNCDLAMELNIPAVGSMPHEWIMGIGALEGYRKANSFAASMWDGASDVFLPDTFGIDAFLREEVHLTNFSGLRHDSGSLANFVNKVRRVYPTKKICFSNSVKLSQAPVIADFVENSSFGFGGALTNPECGRLEAVVKLWSVDGINTVKLPDDPGKEFGEPEMVTAVKRILR